MKKQQTLTEQIEFRLYLIGRKQNQFHNLKELLKDLERELDYQSGIHQELLSRQDLETKKETKGKKEV